MYSMYMYKVFKRRKQKGYFLYLYHFSFIMYVIYILYIYIYKNEIVCNKPCKLLSREITFSLLNLMSITN